MPSRFLPAALVALALFAVTVSGSHAQRANSHFTFSHWLTAMNNGDLNGAAQYVAGDFSVTLPDGTQVTGAVAGLQAIAALGTPITVVALSPTSRMEIDAQLQFGAGGSTMAVVITGERGTIGSITIATAGS